jgi:hypothetical protein
MKPFAVTAFCLVLFSKASFSQVIPVEPLKKGFFGSQSTMTMLHERSEAETTIVVVMGYPGSFGLRAGDFSVSNTTARMMSDFVYRSDARASVVILDSPFLLHGLQARSSSDHLDRIESVVNYYKEKLKVSVWLLGHSDGSISVSEYLNGSEQRRKSVAGVILSSGRDETRITTDWNVPSLVIHHEKDGCEYTTFHGAKRVFSRIREKNTAPTEFAVVTSGSAGVGAPCSTGYHMYLGAYHEMMGLMAGFISRHR